MLLQKRKYPIGTQDFNNLRQDGYVYVDKTAFIDWFMGSECTGWAPNPAHSAVAPSIWGPWTQIGNPCVDDDKETTYKWKYPKTSNK
ncbi:MAG: AAA family ATPase [Tannerella sp.]|jgi:hypothetical protein|nr:AAA family ATPase [Tannerella sp.]